MEVEKPCSPGHCLGMLNDNMRSDILKGVHECIEVKLPERGQKSPLEILIESIEETVKRFENHDPRLVGPNPLNTDPSYTWETFRPESDYRHDMELLKSQLHSLKEILSDINERWS